MTGSGHHAPASFQDASIIVVMGVSSSGKSTIGAALAEALGVPFLDADSYHQDASIARMRAGIRLTDEDRWPWLARSADALAAPAHASGTVVGACSALRRAYRDFLTAHAGAPILFSHLDGDRALITRRIARRAHHYMPASLLDSQFESLEVPAADENALIVPVDLPVPDVVSRILAQIRQRPASPA